MKFIDMEKLRHYIIFRQKITERNILIKNIKSLKYILL